MELPSQNACLGVYGDVKARFLHHKDRDDLKTFLLTLHIRSLLCHSAHMLGVLWAVRAKFPPQLIVVLSPTTLTCLHFCIAKVKMDLSTISCHSISPT